MALFRPLSRFYGGPWPPAPPSSYTPVEGCIKGESGVSFKILGDVIRVNQGFILKFLRGVTMMNRGLILKFLRGVTMMNQGFLLK